MKAPVPTDQPSPPALCYSFESLKLKVPERWCVDPWVGHRPLLSDALCTISCSVPYSPFQTSSPFPSLTPIIHNTFVYLLNP